MLSQGQFFFMLHLILGVGFIHAYAGGMATMVRPTVGVVARRVRAICAVALAVIAWATVITGTWLVYPGYRAKPGPDDDLIDHPKESLIADPATEVWHSFGMEWKEHVGWLVPFIATAVAYLVIRHADLLHTSRAVRRICIALFSVAFWASIAAAGLGSVINIVAPNQFLD